MGDLWILWGLTAGILVNYLADTLPTTRTLSRPNWWPVTSGNLIKYFSTIRVITIIGVYLALTFGLSAYPPAEFSAGQLFLLFVYFGLVVVVDIEHRAVLHPVSIAGALVMAGIGIGRHGILSTFVGGAVGFTLMLGFHYLGDLIARKVLRSPAGPEEPALGLGDVNLAGVIGLLMGWPGVMAAFVLGIFLGGIFSLFYMGILSMIGRYTRLSTIPYAPFLCLGAIGTILLSVY
ncbi:MAG: prepilin peptidase [Anaerolineales bacterium]